MRCEAILSVKRFTTNLTFIDKYSREMYSLYMIPDIGFLFVSLTTDFTSEKSRLFLDVNIERRRVGWGR